jgi:hypothetical protein
MLTSAIYRRTDHVVMRDVCHKHNINKQTNLLVVYTMLMEEPSCDRFSFAERPCVLWLES